MFNEKLKKIRIEKGVTQQEVADYLNIKRPTYTRYESGTNEPDVQTITKLCRFFNVSVDYLLEYETEQKEKPIENIDEPEKSPRRKFLEEQLKDARFALLRNPSNDSDELTDDELEEIVGLIKYVKSKKEFRPKFMDWKDPK